jgi:hypothetical protein
MADDARVKWELANHYGILIDQASDTWCSGRMMDVLEIDDGNAGLLVASETGGVWSLDHSNNPLPLSNTWDHPDVACLAPGPDGPFHFFAGCRGGVIYETEASHPTPLLAWSPVTEALPKSAGDVHDIAIMTKPRLIFAACIGGLTGRRSPRKRHGGAS